MATITIKGICVLVDDDDLTSVQKHSWWFTPQGYACTKIRWPDGRRRTIGMHRLILGDPDSHAIDHINRNKLDNRRCNIRACSDAINNKNRPTVVGKASSYRGVSKRGTRWQVVIRINGKVKWLKSFADEHEAGAFAAPYFSGIMA
jgi:hypothetical protein